MIWQAWTSSTFLLSTLDSAEEKSHWTEIEDDTKKLQEIIQTQQEQINELASLISLQVKEETEPAPAADELAPVAIPSPALESITPNPIETQPEVEEDAPTTSPAPASAATGTGSNTLFARFKVFLQGAEVVVSEPSLVNHSPGISPSHSLATLTTEAMNTTTDPAPMDDRKEEEEEPAMPPAVVAPPSPMSPEEVEECPLCRQQFIIRAEHDREVFGDHVHNCLFLPSVQPAPAEYSCPRCEQKFPGNDERTYHQHLSDCFNQE